MTSAHPADITSAATRLRSIADQANQAPWFTVTARTDAATHIDIDGVIGWDLTSSEFKAALDGVTSDTIEININSPGGNLWDGISISNTLRQHRARVRVNAVGLVASAASVVAMAGDEILAWPGAMFMVHNPRAVALEATATDLRDLADLLDKTGIDMAGIYARRTGRSPAEWLERMAAEEWYTGAEAVEHGLADGLADLDDDETPPDAVATTKWDLTAFGYLYDGRPNAPAPTPADPWATVAALFTPTPSPDVSDWSAIAASLGKVPR